MKSVYFFFYVYLLVLIPHLSVAQQIKSLETFTSDHVSIIDITNTGKVWVGTNNEGCAVYAANTWTTFDSTNTPMQSDDITAICLYPIAGVLHSFMGTAKGVFYKYNTTWDSLAGLPNLYVTGIVKSQNDSLWVSTGTGISLYSGSALQHLADYTVSNSNLPDSVISCMQSNVSNSLGYAAGTPADGFFYTTDGATFTHKTVAAGGLVDDHVNCIYTQTGGSTYYVGTTGGLSMCSSTCTNFTTADGLPDNDITTLTMDCQDRLWIGTRTKGLAIYNGSTFYKIDTSNGLSTNQITSISCDTSCHCWVGTADKGIIIIDSSLTQFNGLNLPTGTTDITASTMHIYPQPASTQVTIDMPVNNEIITISITDMSGRSVYQSAITSSHQSLDITSIESGLYLYSISSQHDLLYHGKILVAR